MYFQTKDIGKAVFCFVYSSFPFSKSLFLSLPLSMSFSFLLHAHLVTPTQSIHLNPLPPPCWCGVVQQSISLDSHLLVSQQFSPLPCFLCLSPHLFFHSPTVSFSFSSSLFSFSPLSFPFLLSLVFVCCRVECGIFFLSDRTGQLTKGQA